ncbi:MAG: YihY/virulence factor BrkB family protein [Flavobacteriales bacterium]
MASRAAAVTFRFLLAAFPMVICIFSLIPFVPIDNFQNSIIDYMQGFFPAQVYDFFDEALVDLIKRKRTFLLSIGFLITIYFASNGIKALLEAFSSSSHLEIKRSFLQQSIWSLGILFMFILLSVLLTLISAAGQFMIDYFYRIGWIESGIGYSFMIVFKNTILFLLYYFVINLLYNIGNTEQKKWKFFTAGATMATLLIIALQKGFSFYLMDIAKFDKLYGPLGAFLAFLLFFYYLFYLLIIGFELNASIHGAKKKRMNS